MIKVTGLNKFYNKGKSNELHVINNTSLTLEDTGLVCILGESGSGKTTLMNTISGFDDFVSGKIEIDNTTITKYGSKKQEDVRNNKFGYIFQNYYLLQDRTVEYNIMLSLSLYDISQKEKEDRVAYVLKAVDMERFRKRLVSQLSGGQQQRIAIARALAKTPQVIFADEPTGNLDEVNTMKIMGILKKISKDCLVVVVTHERSIAEFFADRIIFIKDGKIEKDELKTSQSTYQFIDDTNIYLQEYEKNEYSNDSVKVETFSNEGVPNIHIQLICENGKVYLISEGDCNIEYLTSEDEKKVIDSKRPEMDMDEVYEMEYSLDPIKSAKTPKLDFKEVLQLAHSNLGMMGKKRFFLVISLLVMSVLMVLAVQDIMTIMTINKQDILQTDSHYLLVTASKNNMIDNDEYTTAMTSLMENLGKSDIKMDPFIFPTVYLNYNYSGFRQLESITNQLSGYSIVPLDKLKKSDLLYGRMPEKPYEIVVDKWVLENFISGESMISNVVSNVKHFLNTDLTIYSRDQKLTIVGISNTEQPSVYVDKMIGLSFLTQSKMTMGLESLQAIAPGDFDDITLDRYDVLMNKTNYDALVDDWLDDNYREYKQYEAMLKRDDLRIADTKRWQERLDGLYDITYDEFLQYEAHEKYPESMAFTYYGEEYNVVGYFDDSYPTELVFSDSVYTDLLNTINSFYKKFYIYTDDKKAVTKYLEKELPEEITKNINIKVTDPYETEIASYREARDIKFNARIIVTITIFIISMIILYFMMKASALQRMQDIGVYRLLGISKASIIGLFALENVMITTYTSLVGVVLTTIVTKFLSGIPSLGISVTYPWYAILATIAFLYAVNILIGIMPIRRMLKLPPAQLAAKYDI